MPTLTRFGLSCKICLMRRSWKQVVYLGTTELQFSTPLCARRKSAKNSLSQVPNHLLRGDQEVCVINFALDRPWWMEVLFLSTIRSRTQGCGFRNGWCHIYLHPPSTLTWFCINYVQNRTWQVVFCKYLLRYGQNFEARDLQMIV